MRRRSFLSAGSTLATGLASPWVSAATSGADSDLMFGQTGVLSGPLGQQIMSVQSGAILAFNEINAKGGIEGRKIRLVAKDDELKPQKAVANAKEMLGDSRMLGLFGCVGSGTVASLGPILADTGAPLIAGYAVSDKGRDATSGSAYYLRAGYGRELEALVQLTTTIGLKRIAFAHLDNPGGEECLVRLKQELARHGLDIVVSGGIRNDGSNTAAVATTLADSKPQAVVMFLGGALGADLMTQMWDAGSTPAFYGMSIVPGELTASRLGARARSLSIAQAIPYPWNGADNLLRNFRAAAEKQKLPVSYYTTEGYLSGLLLIEGLKRCGREFTRARLHTAMRGIKLRMAGMDIDFSGGRHTGSRFVELVQVTHQGKFVR